MDVRTGTAKSGELDIVYEDMGDANDPAVLLIMGLGAQLLFWRKGFCERWSNQGLRVIRYDNRDVGLSSKVEGRHTGAKLLPRMVRSPARPAQARPVYTLEDMADDAAALLDHLQIEKAHVVGGSMGGMIAQIFAARYQHRTKTLGVIFSSNNQALLPPPGPKQLRAVTTRPKDTSRDGVIANSVRVGKIIGSPGYPVAEDQMRGRRHRESTTAPTTRPGWPAVQRHPRQRQPAALRQADHRADGGDPRPGRQADAPGGWPRGRQGHPRVPVGAVRRNGPRPARTAVGRHRRRTEDHVCRSSLTRRRLTLGIDSIRLPASAA